MTFVPFDAEVDPKKLVRLDAGQGDFYVQNSGSRREVQQIIFYGDEQNQFYAFAESVRDPKHTSHIRVFGADRRRLGGPRSFFRGRGSA